MVPGSNPGGPISLTPPLNALLLRWLLLAASLLLALATACGSYRQVFTGNGEVHFIDADCYSRMTRVRAVAEHPGEVVREHRFENYPFGTQPHTTIPFDYAVYALYLGLKPWCGVHALDLAGAWISPLFGLATIFMIWLWAECARLPARAFALLVLAASPIVAHGFELGRPDHQSLIFLCMAVALSSEWRLWRGSSRGWGIVSGTAWALGLWTSLYEPVILLVLMVLAALIWNRPALFSRARLAGLAVGGGILGLALLIEGWRIAAPPGFGEEGGAEYFAAWSQQIGELASVPPWAPLLYAWTGLGLLVAPVLLLSNRGPEKPLARAQAFLLLVVFALTCWQIRWGYFLPLVYALGLPWQVAAVPARWRPVAAGFLLLGFWPLASEWWARLHPAPAVVESLAEQRSDATLLHEAAAFIRQSTAQTVASADDPPPAGVLAPWWLSPALAYWSGEPALAGSSHESLPGTVDVARFYTSADLLTAAAILRRRRVRWVVAYEPDRVLRTAAPLLGLTKISTRALGFVLYQRPAAAPPFLRLSLVNPYFKIYEVQVGSLPP